uniref:Uncharacterized protein n=1 Tax=Anguilla anguilla TaxID=7936 RepID=A0A0E9W981_ANGAN
MVMPHIQVMVQLVRKATHCVYSQVLSIAIADLGLTQKRDSLHLKYDEDRNRTIKQTGTWHTMQKHSVIDKPKA